MKYPVSIATVALACILAAIPFANVHAVYGLLPVASSSPAVFAYAHGVAQADGELFIGMADYSPNRFPANQIVIFPDPANLNIYRTVNMARPGGVETMTYDPLADKVYFELADNGRLELYSLDPRTYSVSTIISTSTIDAGRRPAIVTDGVYIYGITNTSPSVVFRVRLDDGSLAYSAGGHISNGHSASIGVYASSTELYFGGGMADTFEKVDASTLLPIQSIRIPRCSLSNDQAFLQRSPTDGYVYVGCEIRPYGYRIRTSNMNVRQIPLPGSSFGLFNFDGDIYNAGLDGTIDVLRGGSLTNRDRYVITNTAGIQNQPGQSLELNELFYASTTKSLYFTAWWGVPGLYEVKM